MINICTYDQMVDFQRPGHIACQHKKKCSDTSKTSRHCARIITETAYSYVRISCLLFLAVSLHNYVKLVTGEEQPNKT